MGWGRAAAPLGVGLLVWASGLAWAAPGGAKVPSARRALARLQPAHVRARPLVLSLQGDVLQAPQAPDGPSVPGVGAGRDEGQVHPAGLAGATPGPAPGASRGAAPRLLRWILGPQGRARVDLVRLSSTRVGQPSQVTYLPPNQVPPWLRLLAGDSPAEVATAWDVDRAKTSLAHDGGTILVVVGAGPRDRMSPQFHLERDTGRLRRVIWRDAEGAIHDVRLDGALVMDDASTGWPARLVERVGSEVRRWELTAVHEGVVLEPGQLTPPPPPSPDPSTAPSPPPTLDPSGPETRQPWAPGRPSAAAPRAGRPAVPAP